MIIFIHLISKFRRGIYYLIVSLSDNHLSMKLKGTIDLLSVDMYVIQSVRWSLRLSIRLSSKSVNVNSGLYSTMHWQILMKMATKVKYE